ncbi:MAG: hypothetical protein IJE77_03935 [Thermoguttaceae bacterium]|nr:hypothetical protein [Thermoguttaceae bacterium]
MNETDFLIEQAVFLTNLTRRSEDGRNEAALLDATERASRADLDVALDWASRVETFDAGYDSRNLFFLPTASGAFAVGRLTPAAPEAGEGAFYFQTFFIEEDAFFQCGANPIALLHLALNTARFALYRPGAKLEAFRLEARAPWIDQEGLRRTTERLGTRALTTLIQTVLESKRTTFVADYNAYLVVAALFELTPIHWRPALTFAVGVRFREDRVLRALGATARRNDEGPRVDGGASFCDLRDVVENDDAYPIENPWAALVELALRKSRVDYLYERMVEDFFLYQKNGDGDGERVATSDEVAELGARWRSGLESAICGEDANGEADDSNAESFFDDERDEDDAADDERSDEGESFFVGEFEGGWRDSDGDERWRVDEADAAEKQTPTDERVAPEFIFKVVEPTEAERAEIENDREKGREKNAALKRNDNNDKKKRRAASLDDIFAGESFEDEWAATEGRRSGREEEEAGAVESEGERSDVGDESEREERNDRNDKEAALEALRRVFAGKDGVSGAGGTRRKAVARRFDEFLELLKLERAFDEPLGLDALANLNALLDERGAEALERLGRAARRDVGKRVDDDRRASERDARRLRLAPFAALSAEFPGWNEELRKFDALFDDACVGNDAAAETLRDFWRRWRRDLDEETVDRIRGAYEERLRGRLTAEDGGSIERTERLLAALAIYSAIFLER